MTDAQLGLLIAEIAAAATSLAAAIKWAVSRVVKALDENRRTGRSMVIGELAADHLGHVSILDALIVNRDGIRRV